MHTPTNINSFCDFAMCMVMCTPISAAGSNDNATELLPGNVGILTADDGTQLVIYGEVVSAIQPLSVDSGSSVTYRFDIPAASNIGGSATVYDHDGGLSSTVYLTLDYKTRNTPTEYLLTRVSGYWVISDPKASVESAAVSYGCNGTFPKSVNYQSTFDVPVNNYFSIYTGFTQYVAGDSCAIVGAYLTVNYLMGTARRWDFTLYNTLINT